ncbi:urease accessory protein UreF [Gracilibacillus oryzae]|uniref:Urease accessory protein UreF n=1 Tax=Gracilibacillus oryzae TaxID=1672701 RepID=A0A7C8KNM7_9BACI|nr:urease accessory protein UreF [Gracilibacillus oryzae]KAB8128311.1 urease accessory protein UreF [Gracilibacillus oryzae]
MKQQNEDSQNLLNTEDISTKFLYLMHIHDSAFPIGSYTHSFGMETYIQEDKIRTKEDLFHFCLTYMSENIGYTDGIFVKLAYEKLSLQEWDELIRLEKICHASKNAEESREASMMIGKQFMKAVLPVSETPSLKKWQEEANGYNHFPFVYTLYTYDMGFDLYTTVLTYIYSSTVGLVHNAVRAIPLGQKAGIEVIHKLIAEMDTIAKQILKRHIEDLSNHALGLEISSMKHKFLQARLFIS